MSQELPYTPEDSGSPERSLDLYLPSSGEGARLVVFVHGGAWRTGDKGNHTALAKDLCSRGLAVAIVNYRLSTRDEPDQTAKVLHPSHVSDVHDALRLLAKRGSWKDVTLVGHSVGAWLVLAALVTEGKDMPRLEKDVQAGIGKVVLVDGIYDLVDLLHEYPSYSSFVEQAFIAPADAPKPKEWYSSVSLASWRLVSPLPSVHLWHSRDDELLSFKQTLDAARVLDYGNTQPRTVPIPTDGLAATTGENKTPLAKTYPDFAVRNVNVDLESLHEAHDALLETQKFWDMVYQVASS